MYRCNTHVSLQHTCIAATHMYCCQSQSERARKHEAAAWVQVRGYKALHGCASLLLLASLCGNLTPMHTCQGGGQCVMPWPGGADTHTARRSRRRFHVFSRPSRLEFFSRDSNAGWHQATRCEILIKAFIQGRGEIAPFDTSWRFQGHTRDKAV